MKSAMKPANDKLILDNGSIDCMDSIMEHIVEVDAKHTNTHT